MRLTPKQTEIIRSAARQVFGAGARVYLFGSRTDDAGRGGDIDLYIETDDVVPQRLEKTLRFQVELVKRMGEQKIDVVVKDPGMEEQAIHRAAKQQGIAL